jgi:hypothetical protein
METMAGGHAGMRPAQGSATRRRPRGLRAHWTLDDIAWERFEPGRVDADTVDLVKAAALVERNGDEYAVYLSRIFHDDADFLDAVAAWAEEEVQHGEALGRWAQLADPSFDFADAFARFRAGYQLPLDVEQSVRGSRAGELMARCIVETGTSSYYSALRDRTMEPVLKEVCRRIAADEFRHFKLFYSNMRRYLGPEKLGRWGRLRIGLARIGESEDDELAYAYYAATGGAAPYDRARNAHAYARRAYAVYQPPHVYRAIAMVMKAVGLPPHGRMNAGLAAAAVRFLRWRGARLARAGA